jgi:hypothetical protein
LSYSVNIADIRIGDANRSGDRLYIKAYYILRHAIYAHIALGQFPILGESYKPTSGYKGAITRDGVLKQVIIANVVYVQHVRSSGILI